MDLANRDRSIGEVASKCFFVCRWVGGIGVALGL